MTNERLDDLKFMYGKICELERHIQQVESRLGQSIAQFSLAIPLFNAVVLSKEFLPEDLADEYIRKAKYRLEEMKIEFDDA